MKKIILVVIATLSLGLSANVFAAAVSFGAGSSVVQAGNGAGQCAILSQDATLNASKDVTAAWGCTAASNLAFGAACHSGGSTNTRSVGCTSCDGAGAATPTGCAGTCLETGPNSGIFNYTPASEGEAVDVTGRVAFGGSTNGGSISTIPLSGAGGAAVCDGATIVGITLFNGVD